MGSGATSQWGFVAAFAVIATSTACNGRSLTTDGGIEDRGSALASPPPPGPMQSADGLGSVTLALKTLLMGDTDPDGVPDANAWKQYGYNIDGVPPGNLAAFCVPAAGGSANLVHQEGIDGIENAFGHIVLPQWKAPPTEIVNCSGSPCEPPDPLDKFRPLLSLDKLGSGSNYYPLAARVDLGGDLGHPPLFDGTDRWPIVQGSTLSLTTSYLVNDTWVSGTLASLSLPLDSTSGVITLDIHHAVLTMKLDQAHRTATNGTISGVIPTLDLQQRIQALAGKIDPNLCSRAALANILMQIAQASDIMQDGTQDPSKTCDGISIGMGFQASVVQFGPTVPPMTMPDSCAGDAGPDG